MAERPELSIPEVAPLLTVAQVAERLTLSECTVYAMLQKGDLPGMKLGGAWRVCPLRLTEHLMNLEDARKG